jgi:hypothetical protein
MFVEVWNDDNRDWVDDFKDEKIVIPARSFIKMSRSEANQFVGRWSPPIRDGAGRDLRPKMLRIVKDPEEWAAHCDQPLKYTSLDGKSFRTVEGMKKYEDGLRATEVKDDSKRAGSKPAG